MAAHFLRATHKGSKFHPSEEQKRKSKRPPPASDEPQQEQALSKLRDASKESAEAESAGYVLHSSRDAVKNGTNERWMCFHLASAAANSVGNKPRYLAL